MPGPSDTPRVNLAIRVDPGQGGWGTGDESLLVRHLGGDTLQASQVTIIYSVNGASTTLTGTQLGSVFSSGKMTIGQTWVRTLTLQSGDTVSVTAVGRAGSGSTVIATAPSLVPCQFLGPCPIGPSFISAGSITTPVGTLVNPAGATAVGGTEATLTEAASTKSILAGTTTTGSSGITETSCASFVNEACAKASDNQYAVMDAGADVLDINGFSLGGSPAIRQVVIGFEGKKSASGTNPTIVLSYKISGTPGPTTSTATVSATSDTQYSVDVTNDRAWSPADIATLTVQLAAGTIANPPTLLVDQLYVQVVYAPPPGAGFALQAQLAWSGVPSGTTQTIDLGYHITPTAGNDVFNVQVWNGATWRTCAGQLTNVAPTPIAYTCALTIPAEYNGGAPLVRILDANPTGLVATTLLLDYARVNTT